MAQAAEVGIDVKSAAFRCSPDVTAALSQLQLVTRGRLCERVTGVRIQPITDVGRLMASQPQLMLLGPLVTEELERQDQENAPQTIRKRAPWGKGKLTGASAARQHLWSIRMKRNKVKKPPTEAAYLSAYFSRMGFNISSREGCGVQSQKVHLNDGSI